MAGLFSNPETVKMLNQNGMLDCSCLASTQEEADIRIILLALYSDKLYQENNVQCRIVVKSPDTDVLVLLVDYFPNMKNTSELWFQTGLITSTKDCIEAPFLGSGCSRVVQGAGRKAKRMVLQCNNGVGSNPVEGRTKI